MRDEIPSQPTNSLELHQGTRESLPARVTWHGRLRPAWVFLVVLAATVAGVWLSSRSVYYPSVDISAPESFTLQFLRYPLTSEKSCFEIAETIARTVRASCPHCLVRAKQCLTVLSDEQTAILSDAALTFPSARMANGVVAYRSPDPKIALAACTESERQVLANPASGGLRCFASGISRPLPGNQRTGLERASEAYSALHWLLVLLGVAYFASISGGRAGNAVPTARHRAFSPWTCKLVLVITDALVLLGTFALFATPRPEEIERWTLLSRNALLVHVILSVLTIAWFWVQFEHYNQRRPFWDELRETTGAIFMMSFVSAGANFVAALDTAPRMHILIWGVTLVLVPIGRAASRSILEAAGLWQWPAVILGAGDNAREAFLALQDEPSMGYRIMAFVAFPGSQPTVPGQALYIDGEYIPVIDGTNSLDESLSRLGNPQVIVALNSLSAQADQALIHRLALTHQNIHVIPAIRGLPLFGAELSHFFRHEVLFLTLRNNLSRRSYRWLKRGFDLVLASLLLLLLSPLLLAVSMVIWKSGVTAFYKHTRIGMKGRSFACFKFRTMRPDADIVLDKLLETDTAAREEWNASFKLRDDPRITKFGRLLRQTSLDELPQLINVIKGEMSLVGPRPIVGEELSRYGEDASYYLRVRPGITGLWQVCGRSDTTYSARVSMDAWYVRNWSLWYDVAIMLRTVSVVLGGKGAY